ncbi:MULTISPECIES: transglycosylase domain-containing protein [unclassified Streptomyces]|uniref:transglycosylase domain-containing protein n=1 Tax=unclassified Streptomyces TaxID=2593676 RepID=UPI002E3342F6|nr:MULTISPECIES: transglycosylase domain-containing protein [unclassified Streptomyces]WUC65590.1 transglycosylase domain-containing protein [Streptomyces sp. NBC_00539]
MSEHRRKPPQQPQGGGRAASRRGAPQHPGRGAAAGRDVPMASRSGPHGGPQAPHGSRADTRRAAQRGSAGRGRAGGNGRPDKRLINYPRSDKDGWMRFVPSWKLVSGTIFGFFAVIIAGAGIGIAMVNTPDANKAAKAQNNVFYWADNTQMVATGGSMNRQIVPIDKIPLSMRNAVIAAENESFETDKGVDPMGIARAVVNMAKGGSTQGGSTITQQYVKNTYLDSNQTLKRKVTELFIAIKLGVSEDKDTVLAGYLNTAYYGRDAYGIQAAARAYFGKDSDKLNPSESAFLASMLKGPNLYNPDGGIGSAATPEQNDKRARQRWAWVLDREVAVGRMDPAERAKYTQFPERIEAEQVRSLSGQTGYLVETAKQYVTKTLRITPDDLARGGYQIYTTFEKPRVDALTKAVEDTRNGFINEKARPDTDTFVQFGAASVDVNTGAIVALYGGPGMDKKYFNNNANTSGVPVGSTWKPYVLAAAMEYGTKKSKGEGISADSKYNANDLTVIKDRDGRPLLGKDGKPFQQKNESERAYGYVTLNEAMEKSINVPFAQLVFDVGHSKVRDVAASTGILKDSMDPNDNASFALGTSTPSAIRMADSYATFAASGTHHEPYSVTKVEKNGTPLPGFEAPKAQRAMDNSVADNVTKVLKNVVESPEGTGTKAKKLGRPVAGKTGTTDKNKSAWFVGYTPQLSTAVTLFRSDPSKPDQGLLSMNGVGNIDSIHGGDIPATIWTEYMKEALKGKPVKDFPEAEDIGVVADSPGAPTPTPAAPTPSPSVSQSTPPASPSPSGSPSPSKGGKPSCPPWKLCPPGTTGGTDTGTSTGTSSGVDGGPDGGTTGAPSPPASGKPGRPGGTSWGTSLGTGG